MSVPFCFEPSDALPLVSITLALRSGAALDPAGKDGLSRVVVRMLRRGCRGLDARQIEERIDSLGAELSGDVSSSAITLHLDVIRRSLDEAVELLARLVSEPTFDEAELGLLLRETEGELVESRDNDRGLATRAFRRTLFEHHPYGRRIAGQIATVRTITRNEVSAHFARHFVRGAALVAVAGDVTEAEARAIADRLAAALPEGAAQASDVAEPTARPGRHLVFVDKPERTQTQILIGGIGSHPNDPDYVATHVATTVLGGTFTSRLMREVRSKRGWSYGAYARNGYDVRRDAFSLWTFPAAKDAAACIALELRLLAAFRAEGVTARELSFAKKYLARSHAFEIDTAQKRLQQKLETELIGLAPDFHDAWLSRIDGVELDASRAAVAARIPERDLVIAVVGTHADIGDAVAAAIPDLASTTVARFDLE